MTWLLIVIGVLILILGIAAIYATKKSKKPPMSDYYTFFIIGIVWLIIGIPLMINSDNLFFFIMGLVFMVIGLANKDKWKKNHKKWNQLKKREKNLKIGVIVVLGILVLAGLVVLFLIKPDKGPEIYDFDSCIWAGYPAMESYPRQCSDGESTWTENISTLGKNYPLGGNKNEAG